MKSKKEVAEQVRNKLTQLLTVTLAGGVGLQFDRERAKMLIEMMEEYKEKK